MASTDGKTLEDISFDFEKNGRLVRKQISKKILSKSGTWATIGVVHQDFSYKDNQFKDPKITVARFKKIDGVWKKQSGFNVNSKEQAESVIKFLHKTFGV